MPQSSLVWDAQPAQASAVVLVMHGGAAEGHQANHPWSLNVIRLVPFARALARLPAPIAVARLRFRFRGWNADAAPVTDARWALTEIQSRYPGVPIALVGHSMGGRTALTVAGEDADVQLVVGLSPWIERGDPRPVAGQKTILIHGDRDFICPLRASLLTVEAMQDQGLDATLIRVARSDHAMLLRFGVWTHLVTDIVAASFGQAAGGTGGSRAGELAAVVQHAVHDGGAILDV